MSDQTTDQAQGAKKKLAQDFLDRQQHALQTGMPRSEDELEKLRSLFQKLIGVTDGRL